MMPVCRGLTGGAEEEECTILGYHGVIHTYFKSISPYSPLTIHIHHTKQQKGTSILTPLGYTRQGNSPRRVLRTEKMLSWKYTNLLLVSVDIQGENGNKGAPKKQYGTYQTPGIQVFKEELLEFQYFIEYRSCFGATGSVRKRHSDYKRYMKSITSEFPMGNTLFLPFPSYIHLTLSLYNSL